MLLAFTVFVLARHGLKKPDLPVCIIKKWPLYVFLAGLAGFAGAEYFLRINIVSCIFMGLAVYGCLGFFTGQRLWQNALYFALLFFLCLPLSYHVEIFIGFPLRLLSAKAAQLVLSPLGGGVYSTETILIMENAAANVDLPCSGVKSLFSMAVFSLLFSIMEKCRMNAAWICVFLANCLLAALGNVIRIIALVALCRADVADSVKEALHVPLGMLAFVGACFMARHMLKTFCAASAPIRENGTEHYDTAQPHERRNSAHSSSSLKDCALVAAILLAFICLTKANTAQTPPKKHPPLAVKSAGSLPLSAAEAGLFLRHGVISYDKATFSMHGCQGSAFVVLARSWRGHHHPEQCLRSEGHVMEQSEIITIRADPSHALPDGNKNGNKEFHMRMVTIKDSSNILLYWFQSKTGNTCDYAARLWRGLLAPEQPHAMVSIYLENGKAVSPEILAYIAETFFQRAKAMLEDGKNTAPPLSAIP